MPNQVFLGKDGFIYHVYDGDQTTEKMEADMVKIRELAKALRAEDKSVWIIGDYTGIGKATSGARKVANDALKTLDYDKIALFGTSVFHKVIANFIIRMTGQGLRAQVFNNEDQAKEWLKR